MEVVIIMSNFQIRKKYFAVLLLIIVFIINIFILGCGSDKASNPAPIDNETMEQFKSQCTQLDYTQLARNPDNFKERRIVYVGRVVQTEESGNKVILRVDVNKDTNGLSDDIIWVNYTKPTGSNRILEKDVIKIWGTVMGLRQYKAVLGNQITIPEVNAKYIEMYNEQVAVTNNSQFTKPGNQPNDSKGGSSGQYEQIQYDKLVVQEEKYINHSILLQGYVEAVIDRGTIKDILLVISKGNEAEPKRVAILECAESNNLSIPEVGVKIQAYGVYKGNRKDYKKYAPQIAQLPSLKLEKINFL